MSGALVRCGGGFGATATPMPHNGGSISRSGLAATHACATFDESALECSCGRRHSPPSWNVSSSGRRRPLAVIAHAAQAPLSSLRTGCGAQWRALHHRGPHHSATSRAVAAAATAAVAPSSMWHHAASYRATPRPRALALFQAAHRMCHAAAPTLQQLPPPRCSHSRKRRRRCRCRVHAAPPARACTLDRIAGAHRRTRPLPAGSVAYPPPAVGLTKGGVLLGMSISSHLAMVAASILGSAVAHHSVLVRRGSSGGSGMSPIGASG